MSYIFVIISSFTETCLLNPHLAAHRRKLGCRPWAESNNPEVPLNGAEPVAADVLDWLTVLAAISTLLLWLQFIQILILSRPLAAFTYTLSAMFVDVTRNLMIILVILVSFAFTLTTLEQPGYESPGQAVLNLVYISLGMSSAEMEHLENFGLFCLSLFVIIVEVGFLNILIAQLALIYERLSLDKEGYAKMNRCYTCVEIESFLPYSYRQRVWEEFNFDLPLPFDAGDDGPSGGIQVQEPASVRAAKKYVPDRVLRFPGEAKSSEPWPVV